jgi:hypothetical protein
MNPTFSFYQQASMDFETMLKNADPIDTGSSPTIKSHSLVPSNNKKVSPRTARAKLKRSDTRNEDVQISSKHPKDIARRQRKLTGARTRDSVHNKRKHKRKFDSTLGYPGEGPGPPSRKNKGPLPRNRKNGVVPHVQPRPQEAPLQLKEQEFTCKIAECDHVNCSLYGHFHRKARKQGAERRIAEGKPKPKVTARWTLCRITETAADCPNRDTHGHCGCPPDVHFAELIEKEKQEADSSVSNDWEPNDEWKHDYSAYVTVEEEPFAPFNTEETKESVESEHISVDVVPDVDTEKPTTTYVHVETGLSASAAPAISRDFVYEVEESSPVINILPPGREVMPESPICTIDAGERLWKEETDPNSLFAVRPFYIYLNSLIKEKRGFVNCLNACRIKLATLCCCCSVGEQYQVNETTDTTIGESFYFKGSTTKEIRNWFIKFDRNGSKLKEKVGEVVLLQDMYNTAQEVPIYINLLNEALRERKLMRMGALQADLSISQTLNASVMDWVGQRLETEPKHLQKPMYVTWTVIAIMNQYVVRGLLHRMATTGTKVPDFSNRVRSSVQRSIRTRT